MRWQYSQAVCRSLNVMSCLPWVCVDGLRNRVAYVVGLRNWVESCEVGLKNNRAWLSECGVWLCECGVRLTKCARDECERFWQGLLKRNSLVLGTDWTAHGRELNPPWHGYHGRKCDRVSWCRDTKRHRCISWSKSWTHTLHWHMLCFFCRVWSFRVRWMRLGKWVGFLQGSIRFLYANSRR